MVNIAVNTPAIRSLISDSKWLSSYGGRPEYDHQSYELNAGSTVHSRRRSTQNKFLARNVPVESIKSDSELGIVRADNWSNDGISGGRISDIKSPSEIHTAAIYNVSEE
jgi:hypothetical protein